jgi:choline kinase
MKAVILAAGMGSRLAPLTNDRPKPMVEVCGRPLLLRALDRLAAVGITGDDVIVVTGYRKDVLEARLAAEGYRVQLVFNPRYSDWNSFNSLLVARDAVGDSPYLTMEGDVLFDGDVLPRLLAAEGAAHLACELSDACDAEAMKAQVHPDGTLRALAKELDPATSVGEFIGLARFDRAAGQQVFADLARFEAEAITHQYYDHSYHRLAERGELSIQLVDISAQVSMEIDDLADLARAEAAWRARGLS